MKNLILATFLAIFFILPSDSKADLFQSEPDTLYVPACADLGIITVEIFSNPNLCLGEFSIRAKVGNAGEAASGPCDIGFYLSDTQFEQLVRIEGIEPSGYIFTDWIDISLPSPGQYVLVVCADVNDEIPEIDETNNCTMRTFN